MKKIDLTALIALINGKTGYSIICVNQHFYYLEKGALYRFEYHNNAKTMDNLYAFWSNELTSTEFERQIKELLMKQIQYDWLTDVMIEPFIESIYRQQPDIQLLSL